MNHNTEEGKQFAGAPQPTGKSSRQVAPEGPDESLWSGGESIWWKKVKAAMKNPKSRVFAVVLVIALAGLAGFWFWSSTEESEEVKELADVPSKAPPPLMVTVPAGTRLNIRLSGTLASVENRKGDSFRGTVLQEVKINGHEAIPAGSPVRGRVLDVLKRKRRAVFKGDSISLGLSSLEVRSQTHTIATDTMKIQARTKEFFVKMAKDVVVGAVIGKGVDGTGGAVIGAGVQAGTALILQGKRIRFEPGQQFEFQLSENITVAVPRPIPRVRPQVVGRSSGASRLSDFAMWLGLLVHSLLVIAAIFFVRQQVLLGVWAGPSKILILKTFRTKLYVVHGLLAILGLLFVGWTWIAGGALAMLFDRLAFWGLGVYVMFKPAPGLRPSTAQPAMPPNQPSPGYPSASYPPVVYPPGSYSPGSPTASHPPANYPAASHPPANYPAASHPPANYPAASHPPANYPASSHPPANYPAASHPPANYPAASHPPAIETPASKASRTPPQTPNEPQNSPAQFGEPSVPWRERGDRSKDVAEASPNPVTRKKDQT